MSVVRQGPARQSRRSARPRHEGSRSREARGEAKADEACQRAEQ